MKPQSLSEKIVFNEFLKIKKEDLRFPNGYEHHHYTLSLPTDVSVSVIAFDADENLIINKEYRHAAGTTILSLPGGFLNDGEDPCIGGKRELAEETGYTSQDLRIVGRSFPMPGICDQYVTYVHAKECKKVGDPTLDGGELIETAVMPYSELRERIQRGEPVDGILLTGLWFIDNQ